MQGFLTAGLSLLAAVMVALSAPRLSAEELVVSAAASLTDVIKDIGAAFESNHSGVTVVVNVASSGALYRQIEQGAPADVFASANRQWMDRATGAGFIDPETAKIFAANVLVLAAPADNPAGITSVADLTGAGVGRIALGNPAAVPAGQYAKSALSAAGIYEKLSSKFIYCEHVRQVLDYLSRGEVDGGFVYRTDIVKVGDALIVIQDVALETPVVYPIAPLKASAVSELAQAFVDFAMGSEGMRLLSARGFVQP